VAGFGRVHKHGGRAGRGQRGRNFAPYVAAFTHAHHDHAAAARHHQFNGLGKLGAHAAGQTQYGRSLYLKGLSGKAHHLFGIQFHGVKAHGCIL
jgi:hypothetical protein